MALDKDDLKTIETKIADGLAGAGESLAAQARTAATEAITEGTVKLTADLKVLTDKVAALPAAAVKPEDLSKIVSDQVQAVLADQAKAREKTDADAAAAKRIADAREAFLAEHGKKIPKQYHGLIPLTDDPAKLQEAVDAATKQVQDDLTALGVTLPSLGTSANGGGNGNADQAALDANKGKSPLTLLNEAYGQK